MAYYRRFGLENPALRSSCLSSSRRSMLPYLSSYTSLALRNDRPSFPVVSYNMYVHRFSFSYVTNCCTPSLYQQPSPSTAIGLEIPLLFLQSHPGILLYSHDFIAGHENVASVPLSIISTSSRECRPVSRFIPFL